MRTVIKACAAALAVASAAALLALRIGDGVETDLYGLVDARQGGVLKDLAAGLAGQGRVLVEGPADAPPSTLAATIAAELGCAAAGPFTDTLRYLAAHKAGLLSPDVRERLQAGRFAEVAEDACARLFGLAHPLFSVKEDPFLLATDYVQSLQNGLSGGWTMTGGFPSCVRDGRSFVLITADLSAQAPARLADMLARAEAFNSGKAGFGMSAADVQAGGFRIWCGGPSFHAARTAMRAQRDINLLSCLSLVAVVWLGWMLFRSFRFVPTLLSTVAMAALFASAALFTVFPRPHVLTFVFGTSLIGLSVDYVYHVRAAGGARRIARPLASAMLTTVATFAPLLLADVSILRQMALFAIVGLVAAWGVVMTFQWDVPPAVGMEETLRRHAAAPPSRWRRWIPLLVLVAALPGIMRMRLVNDPSVFYRPSEYLAASERRLAELAPMQSERFAYVRADTLQEALEREEEAGVRGLSVVIPSLRRQRENRTLVARLHAEQGRAFAARTGLPVPVVVGGRDEDLLDPERLSDERLKGLVRAAWTGHALVSPCPEGRVPRSRFVEILSPRSALEGVFTSFTASTLRLLSRSLMMLLVLLALLFRWRAVHVGAPVMAAFMATVGTLGWLGVPATFFTLLCFFVMLGLGMDYALFNMEWNGVDDGSKHGRRRTVFYSFATSLVGLGALAFTDFAVTRSMGLTFAIGLSYAYLFSFLAAPARGGGEAGGSGAWHSQAEQSAGRLRLEFLWWTYRLCGKGLQKVLCVPIMLFIYPFARPAKEALREFHRVLGGYNGLKGFNGVKGAKGVKGFTGLKGLKEEVTLFRHLLGFAWSLADKTDACTLKKSLPRMTVREDDGWRAFDELTRSGRGAFVISSHLGTAEVLPALPVALGREPPHVHAFQQMGHDAEFMKVFMRHFDASRLTLHAVESVGVESAVAMREAIGRGELVLMAGDRVSAGSDKVLEHDFLGRSCRWPRGVFVFARLMEAPVFFVTCLRTGWNAYEVHFEAWRAGPAAGAKAHEMMLLDAYVRFLERETLDRPDQWHQFYGFFGAPGDEAHHGSFEGGT
ncbi:MAG: hypothetical protein IKO72_08725 [Kiritimatiellae bacterium]|nr:hypothetical protein [Kiritimatiellia bacterium]